MALLDPITRIPTLGNSHRVPRKVQPQQERVSYSQLFAQNLQTVACHINTVDLEHGKKLVEETATFCLEGNPLFLVRVKSNLENIATKLDLQKYVYNSILRGEKLYVR